MQVHPKEPNSEPLSGPNEDRTVRDVIFIIIMMGYMAGMGYVSYIGITNGNPNSLLYGTDSWGNICSQPNSPITGSNLSGIDMRTKRLIFYFDKDILKDVSTGHYLDSSSTAICVSKCPNETLSSVQEMQDFAKRTSSMLCQYDVQVSQYYSGDPNSTDSCPPLPIEETTEIFYRCIPKSLTSVLDKFGDVINSVFNLIDTDFTEVWCEKFYRYGNLLERNLIYFFSFCSDIFYNDSIIDLHSRYSSLDSLHSYDIRINWWYCFLLVHILYSKQNTELAYYLHCGLGCRGFAVADFIVHAETNSFGCTVI